MRVLTRHKHNSAIGKDSHLLDSNINPLKDLPDPEKEFTIDETVDLKHDFDANNEGGNNLDYASETGYH